jgi:GNAT superfamily N-acetyltransferase
MRPHELDQAIFDKMDQSPYTIHARASRADAVNSGHYIEITAHHPDHEGPIGGLTFELPSGAMNHFEIHPDHRNSVVAAKMIEKAVTVSNRLGFKLSDVEPKGSFSADSARLLNKLFPKADGSKYRATLRRGFSFTTPSILGDPTTAYGRDWDPSWDNKKCPACFGSHRLGLEPEDMQDPVKVAQGFKDCPHCDGLGLWKGTDKY